LNRKNRAAFYGIAVHVNGAGAALAAIATDVRPRQAKFVAQ
jgi:hypothetical protein